MMFLMRLGFLRSVPRRVLADDEALGRHFSQAVHALRVEADHAGLSGAVLCAPPHLAIIVEGSRNAVSAILSAAMADSDAAPVRVIGAEPVTRRALNGVAAAHILPGQITRSFRPDTMTLADLTDFALVATDDIIDIRAAG